MTTHEPVVMNRELKNNWARTVLSRCGKGFSPLDALALAISLTYPDLFGYGPAVMVRRLKNNKIPGSVLSDVLRDVEEAIKLAETDFVSGGSSIQLWLKYSAVEHAVEALNGYFEWAPGCLGMDFVYTRLPDEEAPDPALVPRYSVGDMWTPKEVHKFAGLSCPSGVHPTMMTLSTMYFDGVANLALARFVFSEIVCL